MNNSDQVSKKLQLDAEGRLDEDVLCRTCGLHLRGLPADGVCPECDTAVDQSAQNLLRFCRPTWLSTLASGMGCIFLGGVCLVLLIALIAFSEGPGPFSTGRFLGLPPLLVIPTTLAILVGSWMATVPQTDKVRGERIFAASRLVRAGMTMSFMWIAIWAQLALVPTMPLHPHFVLPLGEVAGLFAIVALLTYARPLAWRIPNKRLANQMRVVMWSLIILMVVRPPARILALHWWWWLQGFWAVLELPSAALWIWWLILMRRCWSDFSRAAETATPTDTNAESEKVRFQSRKMAPVAGIVCALLIIMGGVALILSWSMTQLIVNHETARLQHGTPDIRRAAVRHLKSFSRRTSKVVPPLILAFQDDDEVVRAVAAYALNEMGVDPEASARD